MFHNADNELFENKDRKKCRNNAIKLLCSAGENVYIYKLKY